MTVLIVGAGVVGAQVARIEVERGERPVMLDISPQADAISEIVDPSDVKIVRGDILAPLDLARVIREEEITHVVLTAANPNLTPGGQQNPYASIAVNIMGTAKRAGGGSNLQHPEGRLQQHGRTLLVDVRWRG